MNDFDFKHVDGRKYLGLSFATPLSVKNVRVRNGEGQMVDSLKVRILHILYRIRQAGINWNRKIVDVEVGGEGDTECNNKIHKKRRTLKNS